MEFIAIFVIFSLIIAAFIIIVATSNGEGDKASQRTQSSHPLVKVSFGGHSDDLFLQVAQHIMKGSASTVGALQEVFNLDFAASSDIVDKLDAMGVCKRTGEYTFTSNCKDVAELEQRLSSFTRYNLAGANYRKLTADNTGWFKGILMAETTNQHDPYAVVVYSGGRHVGYLPAGNHAVWKQALDNGGTLPCCGCVRQGYDEEEDRPYFYGEVYVEKQKQ